DFCSNDYMGFAKSRELANEIGNQKAEFFSSNGSTGSRLLSGNTILTEELEKEIATFHLAEAALLFNSGYDANVGIFSAVPQRGDTILYDELIHASIHDGRRLSLVDSYKFRHNDTEHLEQLIKKGKGDIYVVVESVYSMDGDFAPLAEIINICEKYSANL